MYISAGGCRQRVDRRQDSLGAVERADHLLAEFGLALRAGIAAVPSGTPGRTFGLK